MKNSIPLFFFLSFFFSVYAQENWAPTAQVIPAKGYEGSRYRLKVSMRAEVEDDSASARAWIRVDKSDGMISLENMWDRPVRKNEWETYTIEGKIDSGAYQIVFGTICQYNGRFFYDDFELAVETNDGQWKTIFNDNFEKNFDAEAGDTLLWKSGMNEKYSSEIHRGNAATGRQCLLIEGKNVPNFGVNNKAGKYAEVNGIRLYYEVYGEGQPLVVLHGNGGDIGNAASHYPYFLEKKYKVIAVDSRAQGRSGDTEAELTYEQMASDVNELLNQLDIDSTYIWGHSDGAIVGLVIAKNYPDKVKKLVAFAANIVPDTTGIHPPILRWIENEAKNGKTEKQRKLAALMWKHPNIPSAELQKIQAEVLVMSGDRDFIPLAHTLEIFRHIHKSQLCIVPGATHAAGWEKKELFRQIVTDFFEKPFTMPNTVDWFKN